MKLKKYTIKSAEVQTYIKEKGATPEELKTLEEWLDEGNHYLDNGCEMWEEDGLTRVDFIESIRIAKEQCDAFKKNLLLNQ